MIQARPHSALFPYTTLFRTSCRAPSCAPCSRGCSTCSRVEQPREQDRKSTRLNSSHVSISYPVFCLKKKTIFMPGENHAHCIGERRARHTVNPDRHAPRVEH